LRKSENCSITNNKISNVLNKLGCNIMIDSSNNLEIYNNIINRGTICGAWISRCNNINFKKNYISFCYYCGIIFVRSSNSNISNNTLIENNHTGLYLRDSSNNVICSNNFIRYHNLRVNNFNLINIINKFDCRLAFFYNSHQNSWTGNYWHNNRGLPKIIFGKTGKNNLLLTFDFDFKPSKELIKVYN
jgi:parallel beta-helix repeat protein